MSNFRDIVDLASEIGTRSTSLFEDSEPIATNETLDDSLNNATRMYARVQKVVCGRDLSPEEVSGAFFGNRKGQ